MGCVLYMTEKDLNQAGASRRPITRSGLESFDDAMSALGPEGRAALGRVLEQLDVDRRALGSVIANVAEVTSEQRLFQVTRDLDALACNKPSAVGRVFEQGGRDSIGERLARQLPSHVEGAAYELHIAASACRGARALQAAGIYVGPTDAIDFGRKFRVDEGTITAGPSEAEAHLRSGMKRRTVEADVLITRDLGLGATEHIGIDTKFRSGRSLSLGGKPRMPKDGVGFDRGGLGDQLMAVHRAIEDSRQNLDRYVIVTTGRCGSAVHDFVAQLNKDLSSKGFAKGAIGLVEHFSAD